MPAGYWYPWAWPWHRPRSRPPPSDRRRSPPALRASGAGHGSAANTGPSSSSTSSIRASLAGMRIAGDASVRGVVVPSRGGTVFRQVGGPPVWRGLHVSRHSGLVRLRIVLDDARLHLSPLAVGIYHAR